MHGRVQLDAACACGVAKHALNCRASGGAVGSAGCLLQLSTHAEDYVQLADDFTPLRAGRQPDVEVWLVVLVQSWLWAVGLLVCVRVWF